MGRVWPLTGRQEERRFIDEALLRRGGPGGVVLAGGAGVGKTRLARETLGAARRQGMAVRWAVATAAARALPLGAFAGLLDPAAADPGQVLARASAALVADAGPRGVVVGVDDAHLLDDLSALLVHQLVLRGVATVVVTLRTGAPTADAVTALWKDGLLERLEVQPLSEPETTGLLEAVLGGQLDSASGRRVWELTRGNALFLRHLADGELAAGRLRETGGVWRWAGAPALSPRLAELVGARMGALPEPERDVVDVLALGEPLDTWLLARLTDPGALERAESRGLVLVQSEGEGRARRLRARLAHPLYGETRRARIGLLRARRLRGEIASALAGPEERSDVDRLRRAVLMLESDLEPDAALYTAAGRDAVHLLDLPLAERLARAAIAADGADARGFEARLALAYALTWQGRGEEADGELALAAGLARGDAEQVTVALPRSANTFWILRRPALAERLLDDAQTAVADETGVLTGLRAAFDLFLARPERAVETGTRVLASDGAVDQAVVLATWGLVGGRGLLGRIDGTGPAAARAYEAAARCFDGSMLGLGLASVHQTALRLAGYLDEVDAVAGDQGERCSGAVGPTQQMAVLLKGCADLARGRLRTAVRALREARSGLAGADIGGWEYLSLLYLAQALAMAGDAAGAREALAGMEAAAHPGLVHMEPEKILTRAWAAAAEGALREAVALARQAAELAAGRGQLTHELAALHTAVRFGDRGRHERIGELADRVDGPFAPAAAAHASALAADDGPGLDAASLQLEAMGDLLTAADAAAQAAAAHRRHDRGRSATAATAAAARSHRLADACGGARTPALLAAARPLPLTEREREVVTLAATGLTNQQIAERLTVSVRTVEGHLYRAGAKLGTGDRRDLTALLTPDPEADH